MCIIEGDLRTYFELACSYDGVEYNHELALAAQKSVPTSAGVKVPTAALYDVTRLKGQAFTQQITL